MYKFQHKYGFMNIKFTCSTGQCNSENITRTNYSIWNNEVYILKLVGRTRGRSRKFR